jgi:hypothetical protein
MMLDDYPDTFVLLQIHYFDAYSTPWGDQRADFYGVSLTPTAWFDGVEECVGTYGSVEADYGRYLAKYLARRAAPTDVTIDMVGEAISDTVYEASATVCVEPEGSAKTMRVHLIQALDHWPASPSYSRNGFKLKSGTEDITLDPGECQEIVRSFGLEPESWEQPEDIKIIAWVQEPNAGGPAEVYQVASMYAFPPAPAIPTVSEWGMFAMTTLLVTVGGFLFGKRMPAAT